MSDTGQPQETLANTDLNEEGSVGSDPTSAPAATPSPSDPGAAARESIAEQDQADQPTAAELTDASAPPSPPSPPNPQQVAAQASDASYDTDATGGGGGGYTSEAGSSGEGALGVEAKGAGDDTSG
ncbi:MAG TPA: hypothetical protein VFJ97_15065 [Dermatophilaceae bacterium]|nr:hypothetical protein [Dermatophilaceae bacterium]